MQIIEQVKALLGVSDNLQDDLLEVIRELTELISWLIPIKHLYLVLWNLSSLK